MAGTKPRSYLPDNRVICQYLLACLQLVLLALPLLSTCLTPLPPRDNTPDLQEGLVRGSRALHAGNALLDGANLLLQAGFLGQQPLQVALHTTPTARFQLHVIPLLYFVTSVHFCPASTF
jgi:hypothetical protein